MQGDQDGKARCGGGLWQKSWGRWSWSRYLSQGKWTGVLSWADWAAVLEQTETTRRPQPGRTARRFRLSQTSRRTGLNRTSKKPKPGVQAKIVSLDEWARNHNQNWASNSHRLDCEVVQSGLGQATPGRTQPNLRINGWAMIGRANWEMMTTPVMKRPGAPQPGTPGTRGGQYVL